MNIQNMPQFVDDVPLVAEAYQRLSFNSLAHAPGGD